MTDSLKRLILLSSAILTLTFETPIRDIAQILYWESGTLWVRDKEGDELIQVDTDENIIERVDSLGPCCVTEDHALLYKSFSFDDDEDEDEDENEYGNCIKKKTSCKIITLLKTKKMEDVSGIHSSFINGHILVLIGIRNVNEHYWNTTYLYKITRYNENGLKIQDIEIDGRGKQWHRWWYECITENRNGDIIISSDELGAVVGMDSSGGRRFTYSHPDNSTPMDICTDKYGHILVAYDTCIYLLYEDGTFKKKLLRSMSEKRFTSLCLDDKQNLYVGNDCGVVKVYKYLKGE